MKSRRDAAQILHVASSTLHAALRRCYHVMWQWRGGQNTQALLWFAHRQRVRPLNPPTDGLRRTNCFNGSFLLKKNKTKHNYSATYRTLAVAILVENVWMLFPALTQLKSLQVSAAAPFSILACS